MHTSDIEVYNQDLYATAGTPHAAFKRLRAQPLYFHPEPKARGFWAVTRYKDLQTMSLDQKTYSSSTHGITLRDPSPEEAAVFLTNLITMPPGTHWKYRKLVQTTFTPRMLRNLEGHVRDMARTIVDQIATKGTCDFVTDVAAELPLQVIAEMMGVPQSDRHKIFDWSNRMIGFDDPEFGLGEDTNPMLQGQMAAAELFMYANELAEERRAHPGEDLTSALLQIELDGHRLTPVEFNAFFLLLLVAGNETTRNLISGGMLALIEHPDERARLLADPSLLPTAIEEMLRFVSPLNYMRRTAIRDVEFGGVQIKEGDKIALFYSSANRDEAMFTDSDRFDVGRTPNEHVAFGFGPHFCLGAHLARMEIRCMFEELLRRLPDIELAAPASRLRSNFINGIKHMPIQFTAERVH